MTYACEISVVVPIFNEAPGLSEFHRRLSDAVADLPNCEFVFVDDGSSDDSWDGLRALAEADPRVRLVRLSRNYGHQIALTAGLDHAHGDAIVFIDADLQDPPELIPSLVEQWRAGFDVVYATRSAREGEGRFKLITASWFYRLINRMSAVAIPPQAGDFRLLSRRAAGAIQQMPERARFLRGMSSWIGYRQTGVTYARDSRWAGETKYPLRRMLSFAADAIISFSTVPIRIVSALGFIVVAFCAAYLFYTLYLAVFTDTTVPGWASVIVIVLLLGGVQLLSLGVIGQYIARIYEEVKDRPLYFVDEVVGSRSQFPPAGRE